MSKTEENVQAAFAGESQARNKYTFFAEVARQEGYHYIAKIFEETAENEQCTIYGDLNLFTKSSYYYRDCRKSPNLHFCEF